MVTKKIFHCQELNQVPIESNLYPQNVLTKAIRSKKASTYKRATIFKFNHQIWRLKVEARIQNQSKVRNIWTWHALNHAQIRNMRSGQRIQSHLLTIKQLFEEIHSLKASKSILSYQGLALLQLCKFTSTWQNKPTCTGVMLVLT